MIRQAYQAFAREFRALGTVLGLLLLLVSGVAGAAPAPLPGLDAYVHGAMAQWQVPGLAVAIVKDGRVVLVRGYGVRELGKLQRVDGDTLFTIASDTKAFTAAALGTLVTAKKLSWDDPVIKYLPGLRLDSHYVTEQITLRDLLSHRTGYCDPFAMWHTSDDTAADLIHRLRYQKATFGFRAAFCYNSLMYVVASQVIPAITGETWNHYVTTHLFAPLGMTRTVATAAAVEAASNVARPHGEVHGKVDVIEPYWSKNMDVFAPVGGINSSVNEMSHWLLMLLADGRYDGKEVLDPAIIHEMETPQSLIQEQSVVSGWLRTQTPDAQFYAYGLGLAIQDYGGYKLVWHPGDADGMASALALVPAKHLGVVVLSNMSGNRAAEGVMFYVLQSYLRLAHRDVSAATYAYIQAGKALSEAATRRLAAAGHAGTKPPRPLADYVGTYTDPFYGTARVGEEAGHLVLRFGDPRFVGDLTPWNINTFRARWRYRLYGEAYITFDFDALGRPATLAVAQSPAHYERARRRSQGTEAIAEGLPQG